MDFWEFFYGCWSSPSRGTWIEIVGGAASGALLGSSPSRGTWIEIGAGVASPATPNVVPLTGDVD